MAQTPIQLPIHDIGPVTWKTAATPHILLCSFLQWADDARAHLFGPVEAMESDCETEAVLTGLSVLRLAIPDWVIRSSKMLLVASHQQLVLDERGIFRRRLSARVSTRITNVGKTSLEVEHDIVIVGYQGGCKTTRLAALVSSTLIPVTFPDATVTPVSPGAKHFLETRIVQKGLFARLRFPILLPPGERKIGKVLVRQSDCDGFDHVNNCTALNFFTSALPAKMISEVRFVVIEYPSPLRAEDECVLESVLGSKDTHWEWSGELCAGERKMQAHFSSLPYAIDLSVVEPRILDAFSRL